jgi:hypothetical protein
MMPFRDILKKKDKLAEGGAPAAEAPRDPSEERTVFTFIRTDTNTQEIITPPNFSSPDLSQPAAFTDDHHRESRKDHHHHHLFTPRSRSPSSVSATSVSTHESDRSRPKTPKRLSQRLHLRKSSPVSPNVPQDLPEIATALEEGDGAASESLWEKRATILAKKNREERSRPTTPNTPIRPVADIEAFVNLSVGTPNGEGSARPVSTKHADDNIQEAIRLHEAGDLETSTKMFGRLADPKGENNALSQVMYGLALR